MLKKKKRIAIFGGSFNPPHLGHRQIAQDLIEREGFDEVIVVPCGHRPDKATTDSVEPIHRAIMVDMTFRGLSKVRVELFDLENETFTRTDDLQKMFAHEGELWHVVGTDIVKDGAKKQSQIHKIWRNGHTLWTDLNFVVAVRNSYPTNVNDYPPKSLILRVEHHGASTSVRDAVYYRNPLGDLVMPSVADSIERHGLYRSTPAVSTSTLSLKQPRLMLVYDKRNPQAVKTAESLKKYENRKQANVIVVIGGDGTMLRAVRKYWRQRLPFFGINRGHVGFLLNEVSDSKIVKYLFELRAFQLPLLHIDATTPKGLVTNIAFNDALVERANGQSAWLQVVINGEVKIQKMVCDGALVATAAGSTAYARAMGAHPVPSDSKVLVLVGNNVMHPLGWKAANLQLNSLIEFNSVGGDKRPIKAYVDGVQLGEVTKLRVRQSYVAAAELLFTAEHDMARKLASIQFPV